MILSDGKYFGKILRSIDVNGIMLSESAYSGKTTLPMHYHKNPYFCYVLSGNYSEHTKGSEFNCTKGDVLFHPENTMHHNNFSDNSAVCFNLEFSGDWIKRFSEKDLKLNSISKANDQSVQSSVLKIYKELNNYDSLSTLMIEGLMLETIAGFSRINSANTYVPFYLKKVIEFLNDNYSSNPNLIQLAKIADVSVEHLSREFKKNFRVTVGEYLRRIKIKRACCMLKQTSKDLSDIAFETGFSDQSHFCRIFKDHTGQTPSEFRNSIYIN